MDGAPTGERHCAPREDVRRLLIGESGSTVGHVRVDARDLRIAFRRVACPKVVVQLGLLDTAGLHLDVERAQFILGELAYGRRCTPMEQRLLQVRVKLVLDGDARLTDRRDDTLRVDELVLQLARQVVPRVELGVVLPHLRNLVAGGAAGDVGIGRVEGSGIADGALNLFRFERQIYIPFSKSLSTLDDQSVVTVGAHLLQQLIAVTIEPQIRRAR